VSDAAIAAETLVLLEWPRLTSHLASFASTRAGERHCAALPLAPSPEPEPTANLSVRFSGSHRPCAIVSKLDVLC